MVRKNGGFLNRNSFVLPDAPPQDVQTMRWGLVPLWDKDVKTASQAIKARVETAVEKPVFRTAWKSRRCLIPAAGCYECCPATLGACR
jgi:putative SOS response-associated peptidase YedK